MTTRGLTNAQARYWLGEQRRFMGERGHTLSGYLAFYLSPECDRAQVRAIYEADEAYLQKLERRVAATTKQGSR